ncbi:MAG: hypothetical protein OCD02_21080 [Spirochaetaceae bacterium]
MKKVSIVLLDKEKQDSLKRLKKLGLVHLSENFGSSDDVKALEEKIKNIESVLRFTDESLADETLSFDVNEIESVIDKISEIGKGVAQLEEKESKFNRDIEVLEPWGEFNPSDIKVLEEKGVKITLLELSKKEFSSIPSDVNVFTIDKNKTATLVAVVGDCPDGYTEFTLPELGLEDTIGSLELILDEVDQKNIVLKELSVNHNLLLTFKELIEDQLEFEKVKAGMGYDDKFSVLDGWLPTSKIDKFKKLAADSGWGIAISDPVSGDDTPTLLKGNKITSMIHPLLDFLGNVPGYWEKDVSSFFLIFFTIFFAMIIGDAGYGIVFIVFTFIAQMKMKKINNALRLFYVISGATVLWGAVTGNWFGSNMIKGIPFFNGFILSQLDSDREIMELCFHIAVVHLVLARFIAFVKDMKDGKLSGIANLGWLAMICGLLFIVKNLVISPVDFPIPTFALIAIAVGFGMVVIFGNQEKGKNFAKGVGVSLAFSPLTALDTVGAFGDIISYVRLYAVGLAGFAVAQSFNGMAAPLLEGGGFGYVGGALILLGGHAFNIAMAALSVLVHGVRLNVLEFSSHADVNWTGKKFSPFREKEII